MNRGQWRTFYRKLRVTLRENEKAFMDMAIYGTGAVRLDADGIPEHVPAEALRAEERER